MKDTNILAMVEMKKFIFRYILTLTFFLLALFNMGCQKKLSIYPTKSWTELGVEKTNDWSKSQLDDLNNYLKDSSQCTGFVAIYQGQLLNQYGNIAENSYIASCRKSVLSMLYGGFIENGLIDLNENLESMGLDDTGGLLPIEKKATIDNILTARSGIYHKASNKGDATDKAPKRGSVKPGRFWLYNNWDFNMAGHILEMKTKKTVYQLIDSILAKPLQLEDWDLSIQQKFGDSTLSLYPAYHIWFSTRDMARLGYLMLKKGNWNGQQIIPEKWGKINQQVS